jgi:hypothetical protein
MARTSGKYASAADRWVGMGPYYAMFPSVFADQVVAHYSKAGDTILDPFAGRGTALFSAATAGRKALGIEVNPVGWVYSQTKLDTAPKDQVLSRIREIEARAVRYQKGAAGLPPFFQHCYAPAVRSFLVCARRLLDWQGNRIDRTVMAFLLIHLHGKSSDSLSNQMMQTKAMSPQYAIDWWKARGLVPPNVEPGAYFEKKLEWRYGKGIPKTAESLVVLGDSASVLDDLRGNLGQYGLGKPSLMLTSPPYFGITNYHYDQWIRLWLLGGPPTDRVTATHFKGKHQGKFANVQVYEDLLNGVFKSSARLLRHDACVYVRTDWREPTASITRNALKGAFPNHRMKRLNQPFKGKAQTQTRLFGHYAPKMGEIDFILTPAR